MSYNGWTNYETWAVNLWMSNTECDYFFFREMAMETPDVYELSKRLKDFIEESNPHTNDCSMYTDLLNAAISEINFYEIAEALLEDLPEKEEEEIEV